MGGGEGGGWKGLKWDEGEGRKGVEMGYGLGCEW